MKAHSLTKSACGITEVRVFSVYPFGLPLQGTFIFYHLHLSISSFILQSYSITAKIRREGDSSSGQKAVSLKLRAAEKRHISLVQYILKIKTIYSNG